MRGNHVIEKLYARYMPVPFLSLLIDDCIATGKDYIRNGGARYNTSYIQGVGLGTITDCNVRAQISRFRQAKPVDGRFAGRAATKILMVTSERA